MPASRRTSTDAPRASPNARHSRSAASRRLARGEPGAGALELVDPGPVAVAVDADAGKVDDARQGRRGGDRRPKALKRRIAVFVGRRADEQRFGAAQCGLQRRPRRPDRRPPRRRRRRDARRAPSPDRASRRSLRRREAAPGRAAPCSRARRRRASSPRRNVDRARNSSPNAAVNPAERIARQYSVDFPCGGAAEARLWP